MRMAMRVALSLLYKSSGREKFSVLYTACSEVYIALIELLP